MERQQIRRRRVNLEKLIHEAGSAATLARVAGTSPSYLSQVRRGLPTTSGKPRGVGNSLAEKLELAMNKPSGWMDEGHKPPMAEVAVLNGLGIRDTYPVISWVQARNWREIIHSDQTVGYARLPCPVECSISTFVLRVRGISMLPKFEDGDLIFVDPGVPVENGHYVVARMNDSDEATFKQLVMEDGRQFLKALNPDWPQRIIEITDPTTICGVAVFKGTTV